MRAHLLPDNSLQIQARRAAAAPPPRRPAARRPAAPRPAAPPPAAPPPRRPAAAPSPRRRASASPPRRHPPRRAVIDGNKGSVFSMLDEEVVMPKGTDSYVEKMIRMFAKPNKCADIFIKPRIGKNGDKIKGLPITDKAVAELAHSFVIVHYAGTARRAAPPPPSRPPCHSADPIVGSRRCALPRLTPPPRRAL